MIIIIMSGALAAPVAAYADMSAVEGITVNSNRNTSAAGSGAYFGLKGQEDLFARLRDKVVEYWTPNFKGLSAKVSYAADREARDFGISPARAGKLAFSLNYDYGKVSAFLENDRSWGYDPLGLVHTGTNLGGLYEFADGTRLGLGLEQHRYDFVSGSGALSARNMKVDDWYVSLVQDVGSNGHVRLSFTQAGDRPSTLLSGTNQISIGYGQLVSDRAEIYALYTRTRNAGNSGLGLGSSPSEFGLGVKYNF
ncbi:MAG: porin [Burkholderiales bacterium]|nr:porin [Burkholderiales bacterium]